MSSNRVPLLLDVDTGVDDSMAIALATKLETHELIAVTTVGGNVKLDHTTRNSLRVLDWLGSDVPVYRGLEGPITRPLVTVAHIHGEEGLGGWDAPEPNRGVAGSTAPEAIVSLAREHAGNIDFAFVGPLTNLAVALRIEPNLPSMVRRLSIMGGAFFQAGNESPAAEFNIYVDPEAASIVANAPFNATWVGLDVTQRTILDRPGWEALADAQGTTSVLVREVCRGTFEGRGRDRVSLHDPLAVASLERPDLLETRTGLVIVEVDEHVRGRTRLAYPAPEDNQQTVAAGVDTQAFGEIFSRLL